jgi:hypothetical protein
MAMRYQPQGIWRLAQAYRPLIAGGWLAQAGSGYASLGPAGLTPTARFSIISGVAVTPFGYALRSNSAADSLGNGSIIASLTIGAVPARRNFTFAGIFQVRGSEGAGVGARSSSTDIYFRRENGNYSVSVNSVKTVGPAMPLDTPLHYVLTSNSDGIFVSVNGVEVIAAARATATTTTGSPVEVYEDTLRGGAMDLDAGLCVLLNTGVSRETARALSNNLWQMFAEPDDEDDFVPAAVSRVLQVGRAQIALGAGQVGMKVSRRTRVQPAALALVGGPVAARAARRLGVQPAAIEVSGQSAALRAGRRMQIAPAPLVLVAGPVAMQYSPALVPGAYTLPVATASMTLGGGAVGMRVSRRLPMATAQLALAAGAARALVGRRMLVAPAAMPLATGQVGARAARRLSMGSASLGLAGGNVQLRYSSQVEYARAPAGAGYAPRRAAVSARPAQTGGHRPPATQETTR